MSLKAFHIVFIIASVSLTFGFGVWSLNNYQETHARADMYWGAGSVVAGLALLVYGSYFLKKLKNVSYL